MNLISICDFFSSQRQLREVTNDSDRHRVWSCGQMRAWMAWGLNGEAGACVYRWASDSVQGNPGHHTVRWRHGQLCGVEEVRLGEHGGRGMAGGTPESVCSRWDPHEEITSHPNIKPLVFCCPQCLIKI